MGYFDTDIQAYFIVSAKSLYAGVPSYVYLVLAIISLLSLISFLFFDIKKYWQAWIKILVVEYILLIYCSTVLFRVCNDGQGYTFTPFWSYWAICEGNGNLLAENIMNVVVFVPLGFLLGLSSKSVTLRQAFLTGLCISLSIELLQFFFNRGFAEFDDIFHNTLGCSIGFLIVAVIKGLLLPNHNDNHNLI